MSDRWAGLLLWLLETVLWVIAVLILVTVVAIVDVKITERIARRVHAEEHAR